MPRSFINAALFLLAAAGICKAAPATATPPSLTAIDLQQAVAFARANAGNAAYEAPLAQVYAQKQDARSALRYFAFRAMQYESLHTQTVRPQVPDDVAREAIKKMNQETPKIGRLMEEIQEKFPQDCIVFSTLFGNIDGFEGDKAEAAALYYRALISGYSVEFTRGRLAWCYSAMVDNAVIQHDNPAHPLNRALVKAWFLLPNGQTEVTNRDLASWKAMLKALKGKEKMADLLRSSDPDIRLAVQLLNERVQERERKERMQDDRNRAMKHQMEQNKQDRQKAKNAQREFQEAIKKRLSDLEVLPNDLSEIEQTMRFLRVQTRRQALIRRHASTRRSLTDAPLDLPPDLPNLSALQDRFSDGDEALLLNLFYKADVLQQRAEVIRKLDRVKQTSDDRRVAVLKVRCEMALGHLQKAQLLLQSLVKQNPKNVWAQKMLMDVNERMEREAARPSSTQPSTRR